ncbi:uncharacterized protein TNCV_3620321 [Trichonephila clavipes]|nr:uncharacterized protein TNCV_3620321 [Trichonephila clavipes]
MEFVQSDMQMCEYLSLKWHLARAMQNGIGFLEKELEIQRSLPTMGQEEIQTITNGLEAMKMELSAVLGEIALIFCPVVDCPTHTNRTQSDSAMDESDGKINENNSNPKQNNNNSKEKNPIKNQIVIIIMIKIILKITKEQDKRILKPQINSQEKLSKFLLKK